VSSTSFGASVLKGMSNIGKSDSEVIPVKAISSVVVERVGLRWQKVKVVCLGNTMEFRCRRDEAEQAKRVITD
jgi:hypothetical protein